jgi:phosphoribosylglycinamide formyltransferase 2
MSHACHQEAILIAGKVTKALTGAGIWGVEFFLADDGVYFSELSPRPHDTGMVTLAGTQNFSEFELHARAVLGLPIPEIELVRAGASAVILADKEGKAPDYTGIEDAITEKHTDIRIFGKPTTRPYRRMGVSLAWGPVGSDVDTLKHKAVANARKVKVVVS